MKMIVFLMLVLLSSFSNAEIYKDFKPGSTIADIKKNYPNANFETVKAAWVKDNESFLKLEGQGISGKIFLAFSYSDKFLLERKLYVEKKIEESPESDNQELKKSIAIFDRMLSKTIEEKMHLDWVRWVPIETLPIERLKRRYGEPEKCDFNLDDYEPYCNWLSKGVFASLTGDKKNVITIDYFFTNEEIDFALGLDLPKIAKEEKPKINSTNKRFKK